MSHNSFLPPEIGIPPADLDSFTGPVPVSMCNDYLFRALMQRNPKALTAFICSLLRLKPQDVTSVVILNPIVLGDTLNEKTYMLDVKVELNRKTILNLELQVINEGNWPERSLCYLCRTFDRLNRGEDYREVLSAIQIGILNFTLFEDSPEFFSNYYMMNEKNHRIYSGKFRLCVLDLTQIHRAASQDRDFGLDKWAALFKAVSWEELKMLAREEENLESAVCTIAQLTQEERIRQQCEAREDYYRRTVGREKLLKKTVQERDILKAERDLFLQLLKEHDIPIPTTENPI